MFTAPMMALVGKELVATLYMTIGSTLLAYLIGLPCGLILSVTDADGIRPMRAVNSVLGFVVNILRSVPFLILMIAVIPFTRLIVGKAIGSTAAIVPLVISAAPFVARVVESSIKEVDRGVIEAAQSMGASTFQIVRKVLLPEAMPSLLTGATISTTTILGYSAMAGIIGGGGLGAVAITYGHYRYRPDVMLAMVVLLVIIVQIFQLIGNHVARRSDKRIR